MLYPEIVVVGCGNPLFADDGFGPAVIDNLKRSALPGNVKAVDAGTGAQEFVFSLLDPNVTQKVIVIDIMDFGAKSGSVTLLKINDFPFDFISDVQKGGIAESLQLIKRHIEVLVIGCQPEYVSYPKMKPELSHEVQNAIPKAIKIILELIKIDFRKTCMFYNYFY